MFHISQLRPHVPGGSSTEPPQLVEVEGEAHYKAEALLKHRERRGGRQYLVRWTGYGPEHDEWVHEGKLEHAKDMLKNYKEAHFCSCQLPCIAAFHVCTCTGPTSGL